MATGWTYAEVEDMTLPRLKELNKLWEKMPPIFTAANEIRMMTRSYFGIQDKSVKSDAESNLGDLLGDLAAAGIEVKHGS